MTQTSKTTKSLVLAAIVLITVCLLCSCELTAPQTTGTTRALVIGLDYTTYRNLTDNQLQGSVNDALDMASALDAMGAQVQTFIQSSNQEILPADNQEPTKQNILDALSQIASVSNSNDCLVVYFSGHGLSSSLETAAKVKGQYYSKALAFKASIGFEEGFYFLLEGTNYKSNDSSILLSQKEFTDAVEMVKGANVVLLDTCASGNLASNSGAILNTEDVKSSSKSLLSTLNNQSSSMNVLASSKANQVSYEVRTQDEAYGVFTRAILEGLGYDRATSTVEVKSLTVNQLSGFVTNLGVQNARLSGSASDVTIF